MVLQQTTRLLRPDDFDMVVSGAMDIAPERDTLWRATFQAQPQWGGGGPQEVERLCARFADQVTDVPDYDIETCVTDNLTRAYFAPDLNWLVLPMIHDNPHPVLDEARRRWDPSAATMAEMREILSAPGAADLDLALQYDQNMWLTGQQDEPTMAARVAGNAFAATRAALEYDPYNPELLRDLFLAEDVDPVSAPLMRAEEYTAYARDLVIAMPINGESWALLADALVNPTADPMDITADPLLINAIAYSNHSSPHLSAYIYAKETALRDIREAFSRGIPQPPLSAIAANLTCPMIRAERLLAAVCNSPRTENACFAAYDDAARIASEAEPAIAGGLCAWELGAPLDSIAFQPVDVDLMALVPVHNP